MHTLQYYSDNNRLALGSGIEDDSTFVSWERFHGLKIISFMKKDECYMYAKFGHNPICQHREIALFLEYTRNKKSIEMTWTTLNGHIFMNICYINICNISFES